MSIETKEELQTKDTWHSAVTGAATQVQTLQEAAVFLIRLM